MVIDSSALVSPALVFHAVGVRAERLARYLKRRHVVAFWLLLAHAVWGNRAARTGFHRYSLVVWAFWLIPCFGGMALGMREQKGPGPWPAMRTVPDDDPPADTNWKLSRGLGNL